MEGRRYARRLKLIAVPVVGIFDEDGHLLAEHAMGETCIYYPYEAGVQALMGLAERSVQEKLDEKEEQPRLDMLPRQPPDNG